MCFARDRTSSLILILTTSGCPSSHALHSDNREDSVKIGILTYKGDFRQEGVYGTNILGLRPGFVQEDAPDNEVAIVPSTFGYELAKCGAQYPEADARFPGWIRSMATQWWSRLVNFALVTFGERLRELGLYAAIKASKYDVEISTPTLYGILELYNCNSNNFFTPVGEVGIALHEMFEVSRLPMGDWPYEEFFPMNEELNVFSHTAQIAGAFQELVCHFLIRQKSLGSAGHDHTVARVPCAEYLFPLVSKKGKVEAILPASDAEIEKRIFQEQSCRLRMLVTNLRASITKRGSQYLSWLCSQDSSQYG